MKNDFMYQAEKLDAARRALMAPHPKGETQSFVIAFQECDLAFYHLDVNALEDDSARRWVSTIRRLMDTTGLQDPSGRGLWYVRVEQMSLEDKIEFARAVDELASWFNKAFWQAHP